MAMTVAGPSARCALRTSLTVTIFRGRDEGCGGYKLREEILMVSVTKNERKEVVLYTGRPNYGVAGSHVLDQFLF